MKIYNLRAKISSKKLIIYPLFIVMMGIFLLPNTAYLSTIDSENIINLTNKERKSNGINTLTANQLLTKAAYDKADALMKNQTFSHTIGDRKFSAWIKDTNYKYSFVGENLAINFMSSEGVIKAWLDSPTHKKNLLNDRFQEIGVAVVEGKFQGQNSIIVVQIFGTPLNSDTTVNSNLELFELKNPDNTLTGINLESENLLTNIQNNSASTSLLNTSELTFNPANYLDAVKINSAQANEKNFDSGFNYFNLAFYLFIIIIISIITYFFNLRTNLKKITNL